MGRNKRNASPTALGFGYQVDAAICLFLKNIESVDKIKVEGNYEDVEMYFSDNKIVYCQVKCIDNPSKTNSQSRSNKFSDAVDSFTDYELLQILKDDDEFLYCSNQKDGLLSKSDPFKPDAILLYKYNELNEHTQIIISKQFKKHNCEEYKERLSVIKIPYNDVDDIYTKKVFIYKTVDDFLNKVQLSNISSKLLGEKYHTYLDELQCNSNSNLYISKKQFAYLPIDFLLDQKKDINIINDSTNWEYIEEKYCNYINSELMNFEKTNKLVGLYQKEKSLNKKIESFVIFNKYKEKIINIIYENEECSEEIESVCYLLFDTVLKLRTRIRKIKEECKIEN